MSHSLEKIAVLDALRALDRLDPERKVFGSQGHDYRLNPPVPETVINAFENKHRIRLPEDYRYFMTQIGGGGAGPFWGLFPFGMQDNGHGFGPLEDGFLVGDLSAAFPHKQEWNLPVSFWENRPPIRLMQRLKRKTISTRSGIASRKSIIGIPRSCVARSRYVIAVARCVSGWSCKVR